MNIARLFRRRRTPDVRVQNLSDGVTNEGVVTPIPGWDVKGPLSPVDVIPDLAQQVAHVESLIARHVASGSLDDGAGDLEDRLIQPMIDEVRARAHQRHKDGLGVIARLEHQAEEHLVRTGAEVRALRDEHARKQTMYDTCHTQLTGLTHTSTPHGLATSLRAEAPAPHLPVVPDHHTPMTPDAVDEIHRPHSIDNPDHRRTA